MTKVLQAVLAPLGVLPRNRLMSSTRRLQGWICLACALSMMENYLTMRSRMKLVLKRRPQRSIMFLKQALNHSPPPPRWCQAPLKPYGK